MRKSTHPIRLLLFFILTITAHAEIKLNQIFSNGAIIQRDVEIAIFGTADNNEKIEVTFNGQRATTTASKGQWKVTLQPMKAGGPHTIHILSGAQEITVNDILIGEVWLASGQSNMKWLFSQTADADTDRPEANFPELRMFTVPNTKASQPQKNIQGTWLATTPETVNKFSAVGYYFAKDLHEKLKIPVGIISSSWGGTIAEAWTSQEGFGFHPSLARFKQMAIDDSEGKINKNTPNYPSRLYNGMIAPITDFQIRGVIWYQGEANNKDPELYKTIFPALIANWRKLWNKPEMPFLYVQIAPYKTMKPELREAQMLTLTKTNQIAMAVTTDIGNAQDIHPQQKKPVGHRLALAARALAYKENIEYSGPVFEEIRTRRNTAFLKFSHAEGGLIAKKGKLRGFTIAGKDGKFFPAKAEIKDDQVIVHSEKVKNPKAVRYGWANVPDVNLFNQAGLPASPFRTDFE